MSRSIDQRVVEMKFDNKQFESAVTQSRKSIRELDKDLNLLDGVKALANLDKAISNVDFTHMSKSLDNIKGAFSTLGTVGRSIINKLTTDAMSKFTESCHKAKAAIENVFNTVYQKGYNRSSNLESSRFQLEGTLKRTYSDISEISKVSEKLQTIIGNSVTDTAFGLDQASVAASTLASTFGTSEEGLNKINTALRSIAGIAGSTGADYQVIADIFTDAAGKGVAMGDEFGRLALYGLNAEEEMAKYANRHLDVQKKFNNELKKTGKITAADIKSLESKRKISAEIFAKAFDDDVEGGRFSFFNQAKEANETLDGVTANIGAAMGRLGALFIQPIIKNSGPLVKFLQVVKDGISAVAKILDSLGIPKMITDFFNDIIIDGTKHVKEFVEEFKKGTTPLNDFLTKLKDVVDKLTLIFNLNKDNVKDLEKYGSWGKLYNAYLPEEIKQQEKALKKQKKNIGSSYKDWKSYHDKYFKLFKDSPLTLSQKIDYSNSKYLEQINDGNPKTLEQWKDLFYTQNELDTRKKYPFLIDKDSDELIEKAQKSLEKMADKQAYEAYTKQMSDMKIASKEAAIEAAKLHATETEVFGHDYIKDFLDALTNVGSAIGTIFSTIGEALVGADGPLKDFFGLFSDNATDDDVTKARKTLNSFSEGVKNASERFKEFVQTDEFKSVVKAITGYVKGLIKILGGIFTVIGKIFSVAAPLVGKVITLLGNLFGSFSENAEGLSTTDIIVNGLCSAIEWLGDVLDHVLDIAMSVTDWLKENGVFDFLNSIISKIGEFGSYIFDHWPEIWDTVTSKLKDFKEWISDKIQPVIETIKPMFDDLVQKIKDLTNGFVDLEHPVDTIKKLFGFTSGETTNVADGLTVANTALEKVKNTADDVKEAIDTLSVDVLGGTSGSVKGRFGLNIFSNDMTDALNNEKDKVEEAESIYDTIKEKLKKISDPQGLDDTHNQGGGTKDKKQTKNKKVSQLDGIKGVINAIKDKFADLDFEKVKEVFGKFVKLFGLFASIFIAGKGVAAVRDGMTGFNNFALAVNGGYDVKTMRKKETVKILLALAAVIAAVAASIYVCTQSVVTLSQIPVGQLIKGIIAFVIITSAIVAIIGVVMWLSQFLKGEWETKGYSNSKLKLLNIPFTREKYDSKWTQESAMKPLIAVAAVMAVFVFAVDKLAKVIAQLGKVPDDELLKGIIAFAVISAIIIALVAVVMKFATQLSENKTVRSAFKKSGKNRDTVSTILKSIAALIASIGVAALLIALAMATISKIPEESFERSGIVLGIIGGALLLLVAGVLAAAFGIMKAAKGKDSAVVAKQMLFIMGGVAVILIAFAQAVDIITLAVVALAFTGLATDLDKPIKILAVVMGMLMLLVAVVLGAAVFMLKFAKGGISGTEVGALVVVFAGVSTILIAFSVAMNLITGAVIALAMSFKNVNRSVMENTIIMVGIIMGLLTVFVIVVMGGIIAMQKTGSLKSSAVGVLLSLAAILVVFGAVVLAIAYAAKLLQGVGLNEMIFVGIAMGAIIVIIASLMVFAIFASKAPGIQTGVNLAVKIVLAVGGLFVLIGAAAYLIGKGVDLFGSGIDKFQKAIDRFSKMDDKTIQKGAKKIGFSIKAMLEGVIDAIIEFGETIGGKKDALTAAITKILDVIQGAITTFFVTLEQNILIRLALLIEKLEPWLKVYGPKITHILNMLWDIVWLGALQPILTDLGTYIWNGIRAIVKDLSDEENTTYLSKKLVGMFVSILHGLVEGIKEHRDELVECIQNLIYELINIIFKFFGIPYEIPVTWEAKTTSEKANLDKAGSEIPGAIGEGIKGSEQQVVDIAESFIGKVTKAILEGLSNLLLATSDKLANFWMHIFNPEVEEYDKEMDQVAKDREAAYKLLDEYNQKIEAGMSHGLAASTVLNKTTNQAQRDILEKWGIKSPSKFTTYVGKQVDQGMANGLNTGKALDAVKNTTEEMQEVYRDFNPPKQDFSTFLKNAGETFKKTLPKMQKVIEESGLFDSDKFIIKPGMDLSNITKDSKQLQKIFDGVGLSNVNASEAIGIFDNLKSGNFNKIDVSSLANGFDSANDKKGNKTSSSDSSSLGSINFTQNNYSPKSLSQIDIYRQTENLLGKKSTLNSLASSVGLTGTNF